MKKKLTAVALVVCMLAVMLVGASLAYFTDKEEVHNTFTVGNVSIDLYEKTDAWEGMIFQKYLYYSHIMPGDELSKEPYIKNNGSETAYVRVSVVVNNHDAINAAIDEAYEAQNYSEKAIQEKYEQIFDGWGVNYSHYQNGNYTPRMWMSERNNDNEVLAIDMAANYGYYVFDTQNKFMTEDEKNDQNSDGYDVTDGYYTKAVNFDEIVYVFYLKLEPMGENEEGYKLFDGLNVPTDFDENQLAMFEGLEIDIYADAIQAANFDTAEKAFEALNGVHPVGWWNEPATTPAE